MNASFGRYQILDRLGEGAMGVVYRAKDSALGRVVALKMLSAELGSEEELHTRFQREAEAIGRLNHPNIVTVYDLGEVDGRLYMAMELLEGDDLRSLIDKRVDIPLADRLRVLVQICHGLGYAHSRGVVHRDIKPANILVTTAGKVKLLDFGLARVAARAAITRQGVILGTPDYMSPEQAMGNPAESRSDLFSAGSVFYEFLSLQKPFKGKTLHSVLYQIISDEPDPLLTLMPELPARVAAVIHRMLRKKPERRYLTLEDVARDLQVLHDALRCTSGRSARPTDAPTTIGDEQKMRGREHVARARALLDAGRLDEARSTAQEALAIDPWSDEAAEVSWRAIRRQHDQSRPRTVDAATDARVQGLLHRAAPGRSEESARAAMAELALIAPDDPRLVELLRARAGKE
jgi:serine/threonine protein kinase